MNEAAQLLDRWASRNWSDGIQIEEMPDLTEVRVETLNSTYELTLIDSRSRAVLVRGGNFFPQNTPAYIAGSTLGGSFLKVGGIYRGFGMEFVENGRSIVTSPVRSIKLSSIRP